MLKSRRLNYSNAVLGLGAKMHNLRAHNLIGPNHAPVIEADQAHVLDELALDPSDQRLREACAHDVATRPSLLHATVLRGDVALLEKVASVVDVNRRDEHQWTPLHWACTFNDKEEIVAAVLRQTGVEVDALDDKGMTPLMLATDGAHEGFVRDLLVAGANPDLRSASGTVAMLIAASHGSYRMAELLFQAGANVDVAGGDGLTPLMIAVRQDDMDLTVFLVKMGATVEFASRLGTARSMATSAVVRQFLSDSAFYQTHHKEKKQQLYTRMVQSTRASVSQPQHRSSMVSLSDAAPSPVVARSAVGDNSPPASPNMNRHSGSGLMPKIVYTSENCPLDLQFFTHPLLGAAQIGMSMCPGRNKPKPKHIWRRDLATDLKVIKDNGVEIMVVLVRQIELLSMSVMEMFVRAEQLGIKTLHFPVQDKWVPESMTEVVELVEKMVEFVRQGRKMTVFCNGGKGRTGMVVVATMVALGMSVDDAIYEVRRQRSGMIRNPAQIIYLRWFETRWRHDHHTAEEAREQLERELKSEKKLSKGSQDIRVSAFVTLTLLRVKDLEQQPQPQQLLCSLQAVSGPLPHHRPDWLLGGAGDSNRIVCVVSNAANWHCLVGVALTTGAPLGTVLVNGTSATNGAVWRPIMDEERLVGHMEFGISVEQK